MSQALKIKHAVGDITVRPKGKINSIRVKKIINEALDQYQDELLVSASRVHAEARQRHGQDYQSAGYYLRLYRHRAGLTQVELANKLGVYQHHLSEMENNKREIGKANAKKIAAELGCDYHRFL